MAALEARVVRLERITPSSLDAMLEAMSDDDLQDVLAFCDALQTHQELNPGADLASNLQGMWLSLSVSARTCVEVLSREGAQPAEATDAA